MIPERPRGFHDSPADLRRRELQAWSERRHGPLAQDAVPARWANVALPRPLRLSRVPASGRGVLHTYTVNHQPWIPGYDPPYVIALVTVDEQDDVRLMTNIVGCAPDDVYVGMPVEVSFDHHEDVWLPLFKPRTER